MSNPSKLPDIPNILAAKLAAANRWVVVTGSGVSAESGVPTFRDAQTGIWTKHSPEDLATSQAFEANPALVWKWYVWRRELIKKAQPNAAHRALASLAQLKPDLSLVTQNVDGLHQRAGNKNVIEFHGNIWHEKCFSCNRHSTSLEKYSEQPPRCEICNGLLRPNVVWFGEAIPEEALASASLAAAQSDVFLSVGTSSLVYPAAGLAEIALQKKATIIEINTNATPLTTKTDYSLKGLATLWLPAITAHVKRSIENH